MQCVTPNTSLRDTLQRIDASAVGTALLVNEQGQLLRTITDGDIRRLMLAGVELDETLETLAPQQSVTVTEAEATPQAMIALMDRHRIEKIPVLDSDGRPLRLVHRRDLEEPVLLSTPHMGSDELNFVNEAFTSNWIAPLGPNVDRFEAELAEYVDSPAACALSSGTAAIHLGLCVLGVGQGDRVFVSDFTFIASVNPILYQGAEPVLIDSEPDSWNMSPCALERAFIAAKREGQMPKAVIVVSLYGQSADMDPLLEICAAHGVPVLEDAAESLGARYKGRASGTLGALGCYSFNGNKIITTSGGGMLVGQDSDLVARARHLATQAREPVPWYEHTVLGYNYRLSNILAGVGRGQLRVLQHRVARRREIGEIYRKGLEGAPGLQWMPEPDWSFSNRWLSCVKLEESDALPDLDTLIARLAEQRIEVRHLWKPMHMQPLLKDLPFFAHDETSNRGTSAGLFARGLCLPSGSNMDDTTIERVVSALRAALG
jgi:dTDP-4-amino-4,6-dideoxygalactose transaminase